MDHPSLPTASGSSDIWDSMKPIIENLYMSEKRKLADLIFEMKTRHNFDRLYVNAHQYRYQFRKWKWSRKAGKEDMPQILKHIKHRSEAGKTSKVMLNGRVVGPPKIRRALKDEKRAAMDSIALRSFQGQNTIVDGPVLPFTNSFFLKWNLPYAAMRHSYTRTFDQFSPFDPPTPYSNIDVTTPSTAASPHAAPSPTMQIIKESTMIDRAQMFARGQHEKLLKVLNGEEQRKLSDWLHQYWFFCFKTAKHWGKGPVTWNASSLDFAEFTVASPFSRPGTPQDSRALLVTDRGAGSTPSDLCRWHIHVRQPKYEELPDDLPTAATFVDNDPEDDSTWELWPENSQQPSLQTRLRDALEHNDFSPTPLSHLPVAIPQIAQAAKRSDSELLLESLGFSIMSRNIDQTESVLDELERKDISLNTLHPFHLATSFLDGARSCCNIMRLLLDYIQGAQAHALYRNEYGHTVVDGLMIAIIKSHTSAKPVYVNPDLKDMPRFTGEEIDICGRWDADSPCVRHLHASGNSSIPKSWKHKFCNTSIQTICDCISYMFAEMPKPLLLETPSGLFVRRCFVCGLKLVLRPLHTLIMVAYCLATEGCEDEDLFGILACALCLISRGFNPCEIADISVGALLDPDMAIGCDHQNLTAAGFAEEVIAIPAIFSWSQKVRSGWAVLAGVLRRCEDAHTQKLSNENDDDDSMDGNESEEDTVPFNGSTEPTRRQVYLHGYDLDRARIEAPWNQTNKDLGILWASVQAELLSYRRLDDSHGWISENFLMDDIEEQLNGGNKLEVGYGKKELLRAYCACHGFAGNPLVTLSDAVDPNIANIDVWGRAIYGELIEDD
ncbi:hypothetical protein IQ07DRAFT_549222 [Pyrenochaeta sp. DS3sAY3a]|nr:hypothetical protein IQ07DRAFT_549222 [Pyrenochaeta sp. DS3sAY3a]